MNTELQSKLEDDFPFMRRGGDSKQNAYQRFGCECGDGWYCLLHDLCQEITDKYAEAKIPVDIAIDQVKEKFATLRFYYSLTDEPLRIHAFDCLAGGGIRFHPSTDRVDETISQLRHDIAAIVNKYEGKSGGICEKCGEPGKIRTLPRIQTLCDSCYQNHLRTVEECKKHSPIFNK